ncbi:MAG: sel1 repeat family protein [Muribaculaceae bacterium]|nr:sel1 repeat family protein [Muribaculaceae bacterium]
MKKIAYIIAVIVITAGSYNIAAQDLKSLRGKWNVERTEKKAGYKKLDYPGQDIYEEAMNYSSGSKGVKRDIKRAYEKYLEAADLGHPLAQHKVGACYYYGSGVEKNKKKAFQYWTKASEADVADAHYELGRMYYNGEECKRNYDTAISLFRKAEASNIPGAYYMLGMCYLDGTGVERDKEKAIEYLKKAAERGNHDARYELKNHIKE